MDFTTAKQGFAPKRFGGEENSALPETEPEARLTAYEAALRAMRVNKID